ncbi:unnamed protein product [Chrysodeixis includens]|uniref:Putative zinc-finger domain-containing protein n=1 Tax=Chrysodeixis includens TaxID=689277 RepID=A0A9P0FYA1_CHRIL|nr:unnamed protein product [Chrysodeixis includens]
MKMACVENIPPPNADSEMEEGEIVDDLSDISSEEEFLLRQRLQVLETYNNVLERKKAKRSSLAPGTKRKKEDTLGDLSEISATDFDDYYPPIPQKTIRVQKRVKVHHRQKRKKEEPIISYRKTKDYKSKTNFPKKKLEVKVISESSDESEDEYRNRRRKLADAVVVNINKSDKTSLSERLQRMLSGINPEPKLITESTECKIVHTEDSPMSPPQIDREPAEQHIPLKLIPVPPQRKQDKSNSFEFIDLCTDEDSKTNTVELEQDTVDSVISDNRELKKTSEANISDRDSDEDLELLRQHALKTKSAKEKVVSSNPSPQDNKTLSEDEDSDTAELRLICLKSALLKKAIEMKQKQKLKKKLSQSTTLPENLIDNNTDIESVDMDMGSDADDRAKENSEVSAKVNERDLNTAKDNANDNGIDKDVTTAKIPDQDELEDDEDLLRAKLLTSLSKNLPNLVNPSIIDDIELETIRAPETLSNIPIPPQPKPVIPAPAIPLPEEKRFIINLGESDSEGEHEATKNLTKMHLKLSEQIDFQQKLDMFLKSTRMEVEKTKLPDVVQQSDTPKKNEKFVAKAVRHLPKSEQIEYKNLVKRMAELEKIKLARQSSMNLRAKITTPLKDTLKQRNTTIDSTKLSVLNSLEEKIKTSRKNIAEESAKMLKLKEEGTKLSQKYKIVATELRNIKTAIALNRKQTRSVQNTLTKIRLHHQHLLQSSITSTHSKINGVMPPISHIIPKLQKENNPTKKDDPKIPTVQKSARVTRDPQLITPRLSVQIDVTSNKKVVKMPDKADGSDKSKINMKAGYKIDDLPENRGLSTYPIVEKGGGRKEYGVVGKRMRVDDYRSPLDAFGSTTWEGDPNAILCPFEVGGECKDADCKYLHTNSRTK